MFVEEPLQAAIWNCLNHYDYDDAIFLAERLFTEIERPDTLHLLATCYYRAGQVHHAYDLLRSFGSGHGAAFGPAKFLLARCSMDLKKFGEVETLLQGKRKPSRQANVKSTADNKHGVVPSVPEMASSVGDSSAAFAFQLLSTVYGRTERAAKAVECDKHSLAANPLLWSSFEALCRHAAVPDSGHSGDLSVEDIFAFKAMRSSVANASFAGVQQQQPAMPIASTLRRDAEYLAMRGCIGRNDLLDSINAVTVGRATNVAAAATTTATATTPYSLSNMPSLMLSACSELDLSAASIAAGPSFSLQQASTTSRLTRLHSTPSVATAALATPSAASTAAAVAVTTATASPVTRLVGMVKPVFNWCPHGGVATPPTASAPGTGNVTDGVDAGSSGGVVALDLTDDGEGGGGGWSTTDDLALASSLISGIATLPDGRSGGWPDDDDRMMYGHSDHGDGGDDGVDVDDDVVFTSENQAPADSSRVASNDCRVAAVDATPKDNGKTTTADSSALSLSRRGGTTATAAVAAQPPPPPLKSTTMRRLCFSSHGGRASESEDGATSSDTAKFATPPPQSVTSTVSAVGAATTTPVMTAEQAAAARHPNGPPPPSRPRRAPRFGFLPRQAVSRLPAVAMSLASQFATEELASGSEERVAANANKRQMLRSRDEQDATLPLLDETAAASAATATMQPMSLQTTAPLVMRLALELTSPALARIASDVVSVGNGKDTGGGTTATTAHRRATPSSTMAKVTSPFVNTSGNRRKSHRSSVTQSVAAKARAGRNSTAAAATASPSSFLCRSIENLALNQQHVTVPVSASASTSVGGQAEVGQSVVASHLLHQSVLIQRHSLAGLLGLLQQLGKAYLSLTRFNLTEALAAFEAVPAEHRQSAWVMGHIGRTYFELGRYGDAVANFERMHAIDSFANYQSAYHSTALWHLHAQVALATLAHQLLSVDRFAADAWIASANCLSLVGEHDVAIRALRRAIQVEPGCAYAYTLLGHELVAIEELDKALTCFQTAVRLDGRHYNAWYGIGLAYYKQERFALAATYYQRALQIHPANTVLMCHFAVVQHALKKSAAAVLTLDVAISHAPSNPLFRFERASILFASGRLDEALAELQTLEQLTPHESPVFFLLGKVHSRMNNTHLALMYFSWAMDLDPKGAAANSQSIKEALDPATRVADSPTGSGSVAATAGVSIAVDGAITGDGSESSVGGPNGGGSSDASRMHFEPRMYEYPSPATPAHGAAASAAATAGTTPSGTSEPGRMVTRASARRTARPPPATSAAAFLAANAAASPTLSPPVPQPASPTMNVVMPIEQEFRDSLAAMLVGDAADGDDATVAVTADEGVAAATSSSRLPTSDESL